MSSETTALSVTLTRVYDAPIDLVFSTWAEARHVVHWMKCDDNAILEVENWVAIPGNEYQTRMRLEGVFDTRSAGVFTDVEAPTLLAYTIQANPELGMPQMHVRVDLVDLGGRTELALTHTGIPTEDLCDVMEAGWTNSLGLLEEMGFGKRRTRCAS